jgi:hypothetical protein
MKYYIFAGLAVALIAGVIGSAPQANAGYQYGGIALSRCDGPVQPDGSNWQRCVIFNSFSSDSAYRSPSRRCDQMGPDLHPWGLAFNDPPTRIDD